jgi:uncharacterized cupredoxin-like copper-binding protein
VAVNYKDSGEGGYLDTSTRRDNVLVISVVVACVALFTAIVAMGISARAVSTSQAKLHAAQTSLAAAAAPRPAAGGAGGAGSAVSVSVTEKDFAIAPTAPAAAAGLVDFAVNNAGPSEHEFLIFKTDLAADKLPLGSDGRVDENAAGATKVFDSGSNIAVGGSKTFQTALTPGNYVLVCNLPGHYAAGMHTTITLR